MFFSIIIPVYNVGTFLDDTIKSIVDQSFRDLEIILINDGSTDNSSDICEFWSRKDERINYINKKNQGVSITRNIGIQNSKGQYLLFVDGDDFLEFDALMMLYFYINNKKFKPDIVFANHSRFESSKNIKKKIICDYNSELIEKSNSDEIFYYLFKKPLPNFRNSIWSHVYNADFIKCNELYFDSKLILSEDIDWMFSVLSNARKFTSFSEIIYVYREDNDSSTTHQKYNLKKYTSNIIFQTKWYYFFLNSKYFPLSRSIMINYLVNMYLNYSVNIYNISNIEERHLASELFFNNVKIVKYSNSVLFYSIVCFTYLFGRKSYLRIINEIFNFKRNLL